MKRYQTTIVIVLVFAVIACGLTLYTVLTKSDAVQKITYGKGYTASTASFSVWQDEPLPVNGKTPEDAVLSYLLWVSWGYYMGDMDLALQAGAMTAYAEPRLSAYIAKLIQDDKRINQRLDSLTVESVDIQAYVDNGETPGYEVYTHRAVVTTTEEWTYNYQIISTQEWDEPSQATYEMTYILFKDPNVGWLVDDVELNTSTGVR